MLADAVVHTVATRDGRHRSRQRVLEHSLGDGRGGCRGAVAVAVAAILHICLLRGLVSVVDEVTARTVRTETGRVEGLAVFRFKLWMARHRSQLLLAVSKLALVAVLARSDLGKASAQFSLVPRGRSKRLGRL